MISVKITSLVGRNAFHVKDISLSYRIRGRVHRIQINRIAIIAVFIIRNEFDMISRGIFPVNRTVVRILINRMFVYSAIKISANILLLYSVLNPDTSSDSPSARSNGVRFVSAKFVINQMMEIGSSGIMIQDFILMDISDMSMCWMIISALNRINDIDTSYEIVCAILRSAPRRAYFELEHQPDMKVIYTFILEMHRK